MTSRNFHDRTMLAPMALTTSPAGANHAAVCTVLRIAARLGAGVDDAGLVCDALGLDLGAALKEAVGE